MRSGPGLVEVLLVLAIWALLVAFLIYDTPKIIESARITPSPSYWHYLDTVDPKEDTVHYITIDDIGG